MAGKERRGPFAVPHLPKMTSSSSQQYRRLGTLQLDESHLPNGNGTTERASCASPVAPPAVNSHQQQGVFFFSGKGTQRRCCSGFTNPESLWDQSKVKFSGVGWSPWGLSSSLSSCPWVLGHHKGDVGNTSRAQF